MQTVLAPLPTANLFSATSKKVLEVDKESKKSTLHHNFKGASRPSMLTYQIQLSPLATGRVYHTYKNSKL